MHIATSRSRSFLLAPKILLLSGVGIDISDTSLTFISLRPAGRGFLPDRFGTRPLPEGTVSGGEVANEQGLATALAALRNDLGMRFARFALPADKAYFFQTRIPRDASREEARAVIEFHLEENVPLPIAETVFDHDVLGLYEHATPDESHYVAASVCVYAKATVEPFYRACRTAGFMPLSFETQLQAVARAVLDQRDMGTFLVVHVGKERTALGIVSAGVVQFGATAEVGRHAFAQAVMKEMSVPEEEARRVVRSQGLLSAAGQSGKTSGGPLSALLQAVSVLRDEISRHIIYWHTKEGEIKREKIERVVLSGEDVTMPGLSEYLTASLSLPVAPANVWRNALSFDEVIPDVSADASLPFAAAVGATLRQSL